MTLLKTRLVAAASALLMVVACSIGFSNPSSAMSSSGGSKTYTIGILTDITGAGSTIGGTFPLGIKAGIGLAKHSGYTIKYVVADTATTPAGALAGAQKLVEQNHVFAVFLTSVLGFAGAPYLLSQGIPVYGGAIDGSEWITDRNMFSVLGYQNYSTVPSIWGTFAKLEGVTNLASVGYGIQPSSAQAAKAYAASAAHVGIKTGYLNTNFPLGSTNVAPIVLQMKQAGINGLYTGIATSSTFAIIAGLEQQGVKLKAGVPPAVMAGTWCREGPTLRSRPRDCSSCRDGSPSRCTLQQPLRCRAHSRSTPESRATRPLASTSVISRWMPSFKGSKKRVRTRLRHLSSMPS